MASSLLGPFPATLLQAAARSQGFGPFYRSMNPKADIAVIGAGAAGLAAAIFAAKTNPALRVILLDGAKTIGAKILVSGGGRCNVTNVRVTPSDFHAPKSLVQRILNRFGATDTVRWFSSLGVELKEEETGKLFPVSNTSRTVLSALRRQCESLGISLRSGHRVHRLHPHDSYFRIAHDQGTLIACQVIMSTGGKSLPKSGSDGHGWTLVQQHGHTITPPCPALVPLVLNRTFFHNNLSGVTHEATLTTRIDNKIVDQRSGSLLWTHFGISGPVVLDASRFWVTATHQKRSVSLTLSVLPGKTRIEADRWLATTAHSHPHRTIKTCLAHHLPTRLVQSLCELSTSTRDPQERNKGSKLENMPLGKVSRVQRRTLAAMLTELPLPVIGDRGWNFAEVTAGGVPLSEINTHSMTSRLVPGLYLIGEMLDCDGRIGGFNFQWAWSTGYIAGTHAASRIGQGHLRSTIPGEI